VQRLCVFTGSSPGGHPDYATAAAALGRELAAQDIGVVYGGAAVGLMGVVADAALAAGGEVIGVIPQSLVDREVADVDADELVVTDTMRERKQVMEDRADAFIAMPGGIGTLEEFFEAWTAGYLGMHDKPVVMLDPFGHYTGLLTWLHGLVDSGYVTQRALDRLVVVDDVDAALAACEPRG